MKCNGDPDPGNLLVSTLRPNREDLIRKWARPRISRVVSYAQCYRRRALSFVSQRRERWIELCHGCRSGRGIFDCRGIGLLRGLLRGRGIIPNRNNARGDDLPREEMIPRRNNAGGVCLSPPALFRVETFVTRAYLKCSESSHVSQREFAH